MSGNAEPAEIGGGGAAAAANPPDASRWIAAIGYVGFLCFFALWRAKRDDFVRGHASQAVLLFVAECAALAAALILGATIGKMRIVGLLFVGLFDLAAGLAALMLSLVGFLKALFGRDWRMPFLGEHREKVPGLHWQES